MRKLPRVFGGSWRGAALGALAGLVCAPLPAQEVYKSVDAQGHVVYSDRGTTKTAPKTDLKVDEPDPTEVARLAKQQQLLDAADLQRKKEQDTQDHDRALEQRAKQQKQKACENSRSNYFRLNDTDRIFKRDADGNRVYFSDAEVAAAREQARQAMTAACGS